MKKDKPWMSSGPSEYRTHSERYPMDLFSYTREAAHCLQQRRLLAVIAMSSTDSIAYPGLAKACRKTLGSSPGLTRAGEIAGWQFSQFCPAAHGATP